MYGAPLPPDRVTVAEAATILGVSAREVYSMVDRGEIAAWRYGRQLGLNQAELEAWAASAERHLDG